MSQEIKFIVEQLNGEPFRKKYNMISFSSLEPLTLLQVLNDVLAEIDSRHTMDLRDEAPEDTAVRMLAFLRVLKYKPRTDQGSLNTFRLGLVQGDKSVIHPAIHWLLQKLPDLKKRAYLARFLVKVEVPIEFLQDDGVQASFTMYEELLEEFKESHKEVEKLKSAGRSAGDVRNDVAQMEDERRQIKARIARQRKKVQDNVPNPEAAVASARGYRKEQEREKELAEQKVDQKNQLLHIDQKLNRMRQQLRDLQQSNMGSTAEGLIKQLEEENVAMAFTVKEKLPKELASQRQLRDILKRVADEPAPSEEDLEALETKVQKTNEACQKLYELRMEKQKPGDDKLSLYRQQAAVVGRKKATAASVLGERREEVSALEAELQEKRGRFDGLDKSVLEPDGMEALLRRVKQDHDLMRTKKRELEAVQAENGVKERTLDLVIEQEQELKEQLQEWEEEHGVSGFMDTQAKMEKVASKKTKIDEKKEKMLGDMSALVLEMNKFATDKKAVLGPLLAEMRPLRQKFTELQTRRQSAKTIYDKEKAGLNSKLAPEEQEMRSLWHGLVQHKNRVDTLEASVTSMTQQLSRAQQELKLYTAGVHEPQGEEKKITFREFHQKTMRDLEADSKELKQQQKGVRNDHESNVMQMGLWKDLHALMTAKKESFKKHEEERQQQVAQEQKMLENEDRLVI